MKKSVNKKLFAMLAAMVIMLLMACIPVAVSANSSQDLAVTITPMVANASAGDSFDVIVTLSTIQPGFPWAGVIFDIAFDNTRLDFLGLRLLDNDPPPHGMEVAYVVRPAHGDGWIPFPGGKILRVMWAHELGHNVTGNASFALTFRVRADASAGTAEIRWAPRDASAHPGEVPLFRTPTPSDYGRIEISGPPAPDRTVTFDLQGGSASFDLTRRVADGSMLTPPAPVPTRTGYTFVGWQFYVPVGEGMARVDFDFSMQIMTDTILYARWRSNIRHTVTFDLGGGTGNFPLQVHVYHGETVARPANNPTRAGYVFNNWYTAPTGGALVSFNRPITSDTTIHARWTRGTSANHTVRFEMHGGMPALGNRTIANNALLAEPTSVPTLAGYTFNGWWTHAVGGTRVNFPMPITTPTTLHAQWIPVNAPTHTVTFDLHGGTGTFPITQHGVVQGSTISRPTPDPTRAGYRFEGWWTHAVGGQQFNFASSITSNTTIHARWIPVAVTNPRTLTISNFPTTITPIGQSHGPGNHTVPAGTNMTLVAGGLNNWTFLGWFQNPPAAGSTVSVPEDNIHQFTMPNNNISFTAVWGNQYGVVGTQNSPTTSVNHTVTFNLQGGTATFQLTRSVINGGLLASPTPPPTRAGYTFNGWWTAATGGQQFNFTSPITANRTLYARWTAAGAANNRTVTFNLQGGTATFPLTQTVANGERATQPTPAPTRTGYTFNGWWTAATGGQQFNFNDPITTNRTLHARWTAAGANTRTLAISNFPTITPNGQSHSPGNHTITVGANVTLIAGTTDNWTFLGWFTSANRPAANATVTIPANNRRQFAMPSNNVHYVAVWGNQNGVVGVPNTPDGEEERTAHHAFLIGFEDGTVRPTGTATRAHLATVLFRLMSDEDRATYWSQTNPFADVVLENWFNNAISTVRNAGVFSPSMPMPGGRFEPERQVTRAEVIAAIVRLQGVAPVTTVKFNDISGHWAAGYINAAASEGWALGFTGIGGEFRPNELVTRAQMAALVNRAFGRLPERPSDLLADMVRWSDNANTNAWYYLYMQEATNSHYYVMKANNVNETWTYLIPPRNWAVLERPNSRPGDITR